VLSWLTLPFYLRAFFDLDIFCRQSMEEGRPRVKIILIAFRHTRYFKIPVFHYPMTRVDGKDGHLQPAHRSTFSILEEIFLKMPEIFLAK
jgi:hypothetical protein